MHSDLQLCECIVPLLLVAMQYCLPPSRVQGSPKVTSQAVSRGLLSFEDDLREEEGEVRLQFVRRT